MEFWFTQFEVRTTKLWLLEYCEMERVRNVSLGVAGATNVWCPPWTCVQWPSNLLQGLSTQWRTHGQLGPWHWTTWKSGSNDHHPKTSSQLKETTSELHKTLYTCNVDDKRILMAKMMWRPPHPPWRPPPPPGQDTSLIHVTALRSHLVRCFDVGFIQGLHERVTWIVVFPTCDKRFPTGETTPATWRTASRSLSEPWEVNSVWSNGSRCFWYGACHWGVAPATPLIL